MLISQSRQTKHNVFTNRVQAGGLLAEKLSDLEKYKPKIISIPRGGVAVGRVISEKLHCPHEVVIAKKISHPKHPEYGIGGMSEDLEPYFDFKYFSFSPFDMSILSHQIIKEREKIQKRIKKFRNNEPLNLKGRTAIVVDDGLATGVTAISALRYLKTLRPKSLFFASPVCAQKSVSDVLVYAKKVICLISPLGLKSVGAYYEDFTQVTDAEVLDLLG